MGQCVGQHVAVVEGRYPAGGQVVQSLAGPRQGCGERVHVDALEPANIVIATSSMPLAQRLKGLADLAGTPFLGLVGNVDD
jgi:hypothetical protein